MLKLVRAGCTPEKLSRDLESTAQSIRDWVRRVDRNEGDQKDDPTSVEHAALTRLRRENARLRQERDILRKAAPGNTSAKSPLQDSQGPLPGHGLAKDGSRLRWRGTAIGVSTGQERKLPDPFALTLASCEVPVVTGVKLFLPERWTHDTAHMRYANLTEQVRA